MQHMAGLVEDDLLARLDPDAIGNSITHGAGRAKQGGFLAQQFAGHLLELADSGILVALLVTDLGVGDGLAHARRWFRFGIGIEINARRRQGG